MQKQSNGSYFQSRGCYIGYINRKHFQTRNFCRLSKLHLLHPLTMQNAKYVKSTGLKSTGFNFPYLCSYNNFEQYAT